MSHVTKQRKSFEFLAERNIPVMEWPPQSPDLNLIENLWVVFKEAFHKRFMELFNHPSKSLEARYRYSEILQQVWYDQGRAIVHAIIKSMPRRVQAVLEAKGGWIKY
jgi:hypothetical protein